MKKFIRNAALALSVLVGASTYAQNITNIDTQRSYVEWEGKKVIGSSHEGKLRFKSGSFDFDNKGTLKGGQFVVDMTSLLVTDLTGDDKAKLEGHLKSDDFFGVEKHQEASLVITNVKSVKRTATESKYRVTADLTIKGVKNSINFDVEVEGNEVEADDVKVDRTKFGIKFGSGSFFSNLGDMAIKDVFELDVKLYLLKN